MTYLTFCFLLYCQKTEQLSLLELTVLELVVSQKSKKYQKTIAFLACGSFHFHLGENTHITNKIEELYFVGVYNLLELSVLLSHSSFLPMW